MMKRKKHLIWGGILLLGFMGFTLLVRTVDVQLIGLEESAVGLAALNSWVHDAIGIHLWWYGLTDWLGVLFVAVGLGFAAVGAVQLFKRRNLWKVDREILWLGVLYIAMAVCYIGFKRFPVNYRPVILNGEAESSYPSSHILLTMCVMSTTVLQMKRLLPGERIRRWITAVCTALLTVTIVGRVISGVHWATDILGGILLALALVELYRGVTE